MSTSALQEHSSFHTAPTNQESEQITHQEKEQAYDNEQEIVNQHQNEHHSHDSQYEEIDSEQQVTLDANKEEDGLNKTEQHEVELAVEESIKESTELERAEEEYKFQENTTSPQVLGEDSYNNNQEMEEKQNESNAEVIIPGEIQKESYQSNEAGIDSISSPVFNHKTSNETGLTSSQEAPSSENQTSVPQEESKIDYNLLINRILKATSLKDTAKPFVKGALYDEALKCYQAALYLLRPTANDTSDPEFKKCVLLQIDLLNNMSLCYSNLGQFQESITFAKKVLMIDVDNVKALFRVAFGKRNLGDSMSAYDEIVKCKEAFKKQYPGQPLDSKIHEMYVSLRESNKEKLKARETKEKELYSKMMGAQKPKEPKSPEKKKVQDKSKVLSKAVLYGPYLSQSVILGVLVNKILKESSGEGVKKLVPAFLVTLGAILCTKFVQNNVGKNLLGFGLSAAAAMMIPKLK